MSGSSGSSNYPERMVGKQNDVREKKGTAALDEQEPTEVTSTNESGAVPTPASYNRVISDHEVLQALHVLRKFSDSTMVPTAGGSSTCSGGVIGSNVVSSVALLQAGDVGQQLVYGSSPIRQLHYTQLSSAMVCYPPSASYQPVGAPFYDEGADFDARARSNPPAEYMPPHAASFYDSRRYYHAKEGGFPAMSYLRRQGSAVGADGTASDGYRHSAEQIAAITLPYQLPLRPGGGGAENMCYYAQRHRGAVPLRGEEAGDFKYRLPMPDQVVYRPAPTAVYPGSPLASGIAYEGAPGLMPAAVQWPMYPIAHDQSVPMMGPMGVQAQAVGYRAMLSPSENGCGSSSGVGAAMGHGHMQMVGHNSQCPSGGMADQIGRGDSAAAGGGLRLPSASCLPLSAAPACGSASGAAKNGKSGTKSARKRPAVPLASSSCQASAPPKAPTVGEMPTGSKLYRSAPVDGTAVEGTGNERRGEHQVQAMETMETEQGVAAIFDHASPRQRRSGSAGHSGQSSCLTAIAGELNSAHAAVSSTLPSSANDREAAAVPSTVRRKASPSWDVGAIVWARLPGERWWPAMTIEGSMARQKAAEGNNCWVFWYGDHKVSEIPSDKILWYAASFTEKFSSSGSKIYKKAVAEALQECIKRSGYCEAEQAPIAEENDHLRACARQLCEQKGISTIDTTPGSISAFVSSCLSVLANRRASKPTPCGSSKRRASHSGLREIKPKANVQACRMQSPERLPTQSPRSPVQSPAMMPPARSPMWSQDENCGRTAPAQSPARSVERPSRRPIGQSPRKPLEQSGSTKPLAASGEESTELRDETKQENPGDKAVVKETSNARSKKRSGGSAQARSRTRPSSTSRPRGGTPRGRAGISNGSSCGDSLKTKAQHAITRQQYREKHGQQLDEFFDDVRSGATDIEGVCIACNADRKPAVTQHPLIHGGLCEDCKPKIMDALFSYGVDGCNVYCVLCGEGGDLIVCELRGCGKVFCRGCVETLGSAALLKECLDDDHWVCFMCSDHIPVGKDKKNLIVKRPNWQSCISQMFQRPSSILHRGPSANDFQKKRLRVLSLFDGISTGKMVLEKLGFDVEVYYASEIDEDSLVVTQMNHGKNVIQLGDVRSLSQSKLARLGRIDLLMGGSPCNDLSLVNPARKGIYNGTGVLFFEFYRILHMLTMSQRNHQLFWLFENVVAMRTETKEVINRFLECQPVNFNAGYFSAQNRARYFWGNIPGLYTPLNPDVLEQDITLQSVLTPGFDRMATVEKLRTITTRTASLKQGSKEDKFPVKMNGQEGRLWPTELESVFGLPRHYTDVGHLGPTKRQKLLGRAWSVPVVSHLLTPLKQFFLLKESAKDCQAKVTGDME